jgi:hypothetical protein
MQQFALSDRFRDSSGSPAASFNTWRVAVRYVEDMKKATLAEFDQEEAEWRETTEGQVLNLCEIEEPLPTPEELDELDPDEAIRRIKTWSRTTRSFALPLNATSAPGVRWLWRASRREPRRNPKPSLNLQQSKKPFPRNSGG